MPPFVHERKYPRAVVELPVLDKRAEDGEPPACTRDISVGGMFIRTVKLKPLGSRHVFNVTFPGDEVPMELAAEVIRVEAHHNPGMAVRFIFGKEAQRSLFAAQVQRLLA